MDHAKQLGEDRVIDLLLRFSVPAVIAMMVNASYNLVDRIFIGRGVGFLGIAGVTIAFPFMAVLMAFGMLIGLGTTTLISIRLGQQKREEAESVLANGMILLISVSLFISAIGLSFLDSFLLPFGATPDILPYAREYMSVILWGAVFQGISFGMNNFIRAEGNPRIAMYTILISAFLNTILDPIFIFVFGWGIRGAALATILAQAVSAVWVLYYFLYGPSMLKIRRKNLKPHLPVIIKIIGIGSAPFAMQMATSVMSVILNNNLVTYGGDVAVSAFGIVNSIGLFILMPIFGINQGAQPIIGYNYGAEKYDRVKKTWVLGVFAATAIVLTGFVLSRTVPQEMVALFAKDDTELIKTGTEAMRIFFLLLPVVGFQIVSSGYFQAVGKPKQAMFLSLSRQVLLFIPALLVLPSFYGLVGVFLAGPVSDLGAFLLTAVWISLEMRKLGRKSCPV